MHITKPPLPICVRTSSPASDSGASSLSPVASTATFAFDKRTGNQDEEQQDVSFLCSHGSTPLSSPSKSCQSYEASPVHHPATRNVFRHEGISVNAHVAISWSVSTYWRVPFLMGQLTGPCRTFCALSNLPLQSCSTGPMK